MKIRILLFKLSIIFLLFATSCTTPQKPQPVSDNAFTFAFLTDIHLQPERNAEAGFRQAIDSVNKLNPEFVITGGDLIMDALGVPFERADSLYDIYTTMAREFKMPVYNTMGNHEIFGWYEKSGVDPTHPQFGKRMFEDHLGARYRVFTHKGWRIFILDSVEPNGKGGYKGEINPVQMDWIVNRLAETPKDMPIIVSTHIPFITTEAQLFGGSLTPNAEYEVITNSKEVLDLFKEHNLKLVLQGHLHYYEYMHAFGTTYITAGAVSGAWWKGDYHGTQEGFLLVHADGEEFGWEYVDYGWEVEE